MADQINVVVQMTHKVLTDVLCGSARVADELTLGHLVFDVWAGQINGQQDERVAQHVHGVCNTKDTRIEKLHRSKMIKWVKIKQEKWGLGLSPAPQP